MESTQQVTQRVHCDFTLWGVVKWATVVCVIFWADVVRELVKWDLLSENSTTLKVCSRITLSLSIAKSRAVSFLQQENHTDWHLHKYFTASNCLLASFQASRTGVMVKQRDWVESFMLFFITDYPQTCFFAFTVEYSYWRLVHSSKIFSWNFWMPS